MRERNPYTGNHHYGEIPSNVPGHELARKYYQRGWEAPVKLPDFRFEEPEIVAVVGSRELRDPHPVYLWMHENIDRTKHVIVTGDARGVDSHAYDWCRKEGVMCIVVPAAHLWDHFGRSAGILRNPIVARLATSRVVAFPAGSSNGTYDTVRTARELGKTVIFPIGGDRNPPKPSIFDVLDKP